MNATTNISDTLHALARRAGAELYEINVEKINPKQSVRLKCQVPLCEFYGLCKVCPPNIPSVAEFTEALQSYRMAFLAVLRTKIKSIDEYRKDFSAELRLCEIVSNLELAAFQHGYYLAIGLCPGGCKLCLQCTPAGEPCCHPFKARPSPEGFGIDITELAREAGVRVQWPPPEEVSFMGLILV